MENPLPIAVHCDPPCKGLAVRTTTLGTLRKSCLSVACAMLLAASAMAETQMKWEEAEAEVVTGARPGVTNFTCLQEQTCIARTPGHLWVGALGGVAKLNEKTLAVERVYTAADGLTGTAVNALAAQGSVLWVGTYQGISRLDTRTGAIHNIWGDGDRWDFVFDPKTESMWALGTKSVMRFDQASGQAFRFPFDGSVWELARVATTLWGMERGAIATADLVQVDTATGATRTKSLAFGNSDGAGRVVMGTDNLWALHGTSRGPELRRLVRIDPKTQQTYPQGVQKGLAHDYVEDLIVVGSEVWARTGGEYHEQAHIGVGGRLCRYSPRSDRWNTYPAISGFRNDEPTCLAEMGGDLWVATRAYNTTKKMAVGWGMSPILAEAPVVRALTLNRFDATKQAWTTFSVPVENNFDRIHAMALQKKRLWFLLERNPMEPWWERDNPGGKHRFITGYVDVESPQAKSILYEEPRFHPTLERQWWRGKPFDIWVTGNTLWRTVWNEVRVHKEWAGWQPLVREDKGEKTWQPRPHTIGTVGWPGREPEELMPRCEVEGVFTINNGVLVTSQMGTERYSWQAERWWSPCPRFGPWIVTDVCKDAQGTCWLSAVTAAAVHLPREMERLEEDRQPLQSGLFRCADGQKWEVPSLAPWTWQQKRLEGEVRFLPLSQVKRTPQPGPPSGWEAAMSKGGEGLSCVESDGQRVWVGTVGEGVFCLEDNRWRRLWPKTEQPPADRGWESSAPQDVVISMALDGHVLWIATLAGLQRYDLSNGTAEPVDNPLIGFKPATGGYYYSMGKPASVVQQGSVVAKAAQRIWFSPPWWRQGIYCLEKTAGTWTCFAPDMNGRCFAEVGDTVWIATGKGLLRFDPKTGGKRLLTVRDGLVTGFVIGLAFDERFLWFATQCGVSRLDR